MKINVIRNLMLPWVAYFFCAIAAIVVVGSRWGLPDQRQPQYLAALAAGAIICLFLNMRTLAKAGIWIAHSLPSSLRYNKIPWLLRSLISAVIALAFYLLGQLSWMPLFWHAFVIPAVFSVTLFVGIWGIMGPILTWASRVNFSRTSAFIVSLPIFALVPLTASFLGQSITSAYIASRAHVLVPASLAQQSSVKPSEAEPEKESLNANAAPTELSEKGRTFKMLAESGKSCSEQSKEIQAALHPKAPEDVAYWAVKSVKCADMKSVVALPKLVEVLSHHSPKVRAASIRAMPHFGSENVKKVSYLLVKRMNEKEPQEVLEAAATVLSRLGEEERSFATKRLKTLLDSSQSSLAAAEVLVHDMKRDDLVTEYVSEHLNDTSSLRERAVKLICLLPKAQRLVAEPHVESVVALIKTGAPDDPAMQALGCMGKTGLQAVRKEVVEPKVLDKPVAAHALAQMDIKDAPEEALATAENCVRDSNPQVRKWCSESLGKIGAPALPKILDLLKSSDAEMKDAGKNALNFFDDPKAKLELEKVRADNTGWMANKKKLQLAEAVSTALLKIESETAEGRVSE